MQSRRDGIESNDPRYRIDIRVEVDACSIADNGIGMTLEELKNNFWTMGASGKNTPEARAAGCIGTFGIGGFANFGVCKTLEVTSRTSDCTSAHRTSLSREAFGADRFSLPRVEASESDALASRGTIVRGVAMTGFDAKGLLDYIKQFVRHVPEAIYFDNQLISQEAPGSIGGDKRPLGGREARSGVTFQLYVGGNNTLFCQVERLTIQGMELPCAGWVRLEHGALEVRKRGFKLCSTSISSRVGVAGWIDCDGLRPTAGRDSLDNESVGLLTGAFHVIEDTATDYILLDSELLANHVRLIPDLVQRGFLEKLGLLVVDVLGGGQMKLQEIRNRRDPLQRVFFSQSGQRNATTDVLTARGSIIVRLSGNWQRRQAEMAFLHDYCGAQELDSLIECLEVYTELDPFEKAVLSELDLAIRKLFRPPEFRLVAGRLTFETPIFWSARKEAGATVVYADPRHGELLKLKPLGYSALFWSMVEVFCREYLGDTLKRQSQKFFGNGAVDLDAFGKKQSELWELVVGDIEVSRIGSKETAGHSNIGRVELVGRADITSVTISRSGGVVTSPPSGGVTLNKRLAKLLHIVDETGNVGIEGYYLRIPESATAAFGEIIRTFPSFAAVWFANRVTWQGTDCASTAFLFDVTLDRLLSDASGSHAHGSMELSPKQVQTYEGQIYFFIPHELQDHIVPQKADEVVKIEIRNELLDLNRPRSWTAKQPLA